MWTASWWSGTWVSMFVAGHEGIREIANLVVSMDLVGSVDFNELFRQLDEPAD